MLCSCCPSHLLICCWILSDEGIHLLWEVINLKKQTKNSRFYSLVFFTKPHEKPWKRKHLSNCFVSQHFFTWGWDQKSIYFDLQSEEESYVLHAVAIQAGQKFLSNLWRKQILDVFNNCQDMLQNVDDITTLPFPVNWVFNQRLTNIEHWSWFYFTNIFVNNNGIARLKVHLKVVLNCMANTTTQQAKLWPCFHCVLHILSHYMDSFVQ